jgi:hypothetical protein
MLKQMKKMALSNDVDNEIKEKIAIAWGKLASKGNPIIRIRKLWVYDSTLEDDESVLSMAKAGSLRYLSILIHKCKLPTARSIFIENLKPYFKYGT